MKTRAVLNTCCLLAAPLLPTWAAAQAATEPAWVAEARQVAAAVPPRLLAVLQEELDRSGPEGAVAVCNEKAPQMARVASEKSGWAIRRVSLRNRNPKAVPDAWEQAALLEFDRRLAAQEPASRLEKSEVTQEGGQKVQRYIRALPTAKLCLECHGSAEQISPAVAARLKALYPADLATGYSVGQLRGAITLRQAVP
ncbi:MAG TPA: DUF3365 domain-containing protein [Rubrivivax sp.]|nr:DUF3365 domain-containing protein [Rubrivivax sp.]